MQYGNQAQLEVEYSSAALVIDIPTAEERWQQGLCDHVQFCNASKEYVPVERKRRAGKGDDSDEDDEGDKYDWEYDDDDDGGYGGHVEVPYHGEYSLY